MNCPTVAVAISGFILLSGCQSNARKGEIGTFKVGERAQIGSMIYNVFDTQYLLKIGEGTEARVPKDRFFLVHFSAVNGGGSTSEASIPALTLIDDAGQSYNELDNGAGVPQWLGFSRKIRPAESVTGDVIFDVAPKHYRLRITDETEEHYAFVDLPLTFGTPAAPVESTVPTPR